MLLIDVHQICMSLKAVLGRTGKDTIHLQNSRIIKAIERKQGSKDYFRFLKKNFDLNWKPVMNANYFINALLFSILATLLYASRIHSMCANAHGYMV